MLGQTATAPDTRQKLHTGASTTPIGRRGVPTTETTFTHPVSGVKSDFGGTARGTAFASSDSWVRMLRFLAEALPRPPDH